MKKNSIVVTGTPGTGKTTLCRKISEVKGWVHIDLGEFVVTNGLYIGYDRKRGSYVVDLRSTRARVAKVLRGGDRTYLLDGCFSHLVTPLRTTFGVVVLRTNPLELLRRLSTRPKEKALENAQAEALDVILIETISKFGKAYEIDTTNRSVEEVAEKFLEAYESGFPPRFGLTNWLQELHDSGKFDVVFGRASL